MSGIKLNSTAGGSISISPTNATEDYVIDINDLIKSTFTAKFSTPGILVPRSTDTGLPIFDNVSFELTGESNGQVVQYVSAQSDSDSTFVNNSFRIGSSETTGFSDIEYQGISIGTPTNVNGLAVFDSVSSMTDSPAYLTVPVRYKNTLGVISQAASAKIQFVYADSGSAGKDAVFVDISGYTSFSQNAGGAFTPANATLTAITSGIQEPVYTWTIEGADYQTNIDQVVVTPNQNTNYVRVTLSVSGSNINNPVSKTLSMAVVYSGQTGQAGSNGMMAAFPAIYKWTDSETEPTRPNSASTYTWATAQYAAPSGWSTSVPSNTTQGQYLWSITIPINAVATTEETTLNWASTANPIRAIAYNGFDGADGTGSVTAFLSNDSHTVPASSSGAVTSFSGAATTMLVFIGDDDDSENWTYSCQYTGVTSAELATSRTQTVNSFLNGFDIGYIDITASKTGYSSITKRFTVSKSKQGSDGSPAVTYYITSNALTINKSISGVFTPSSVSASVYRTIGVGIPTLQNIYYFKVDTSTDGTTFTNRKQTTTAASSVDYTPIPADTKAIRVSAYLESTFVNLVDQQTYMVVSDGATGQTGNTGSVGSPGSATFVVTRIADDSSAPTNTEVIAAIGRSPVSGDVCTVSYNNYNNATIYRRAASNWALFTSYITGSLIVENTITGNKLVANSVTADRIDTRGLSIKDNAGNVILSAGNALDFSNVGGATKPANNANNTYIDSTGNIQGVSSGAGQSVANNTDNVIRAPGGGIFNSFENKTGRLKIRLPQFFTYTMIRFTVEIYEYETDYSCTLEIAGYIYGGASVENPEKNWYNVTARVIGGSTVEYPVYFGHDGTKACVWVGNTKDDAWTFPQVRIRDVFTGWLNTEREKWESGWNISFDQTDITQGTDANQYSTNVIDTLPGANWTKISGSGKPENNATRNVFVGSWTTGTAYKVGDIVTDSSGNGWSCILNHTSSSSIKTPDYPAESSNTYWKLYTVKGSDAVSAVLSNEDHSFSATSSGTVSVYNGSGTQLRVYEGSKLLTYDAVGTEKGKWKVLISGDSITPSNTLTNNTSYVTIGDHSNIIADSATITYDITGVSSVGVPFTITKTQSFSKSKQGIDGSQGPSIVVTANNPTVFTATDGNLDSGQSDITFTATVYGITSPTYSWSFSGFDTNPTASTTSTQTITASQFGNSKSAKVTCTVNSIYQDSVTVVRLEKSTAAAGATVGADWETNVQKRPTDTSNLIRKGVFDDGNPGSWTYSGIENRVNSGMPYAKNIYFNVRDSLENTEGFPVTPDETLYAAAWLETLAISNYTCRLGVRVMDAAGNVVQWLGICEIAPNTAWTYVSGSAKIPANGVKAHPWIQIDTFAAPTNAFCRAAGIWIGRHAPGATVGAPTGTYVGGTLAETVESNASSALSGLADKLNKAGDTITGRITLNVADGIFAGTNLDNGVYMGTNGIVGKKAGNTTFAVDTSGNATFGGTLSAADMVSTNNIIQNAVTLPVAVLTVGSIAYNNNWTTIQSAYINPEGGNVIIFGSAAIEGTLRLVSPSGVELASAYTIFNSVNTSLVGLSTETGIYTLQVRNYFSGNTSYATQRSLILLAAKR